MAQLRHGLFRETCHLIESGHVSVFNYGFSFFIAALNEHQIIRGMNEKTVALAFRKARFMDDKKFNKYLKSK